MTKQLVEVSVKCAFIKLRFPQKYVPLGAVFIVILWKCSTSPLAPGDRSSRPKEREKGQENSPSLLPLLGKRMIPHGGRGHNSDKEPIGLSPERLEQCVVASTLSSLSLHFAP
jgi:hypothetical protein